jgi:hypothetical protein
MYVDGVFSPLPFPDFFPVPKRSSKSSLSPESDEAGFDDGFAMAGSGRVTGFERGVSTLFLRVPDSRVPGLAFATASLAAGGVGAVGGGAGATAGAAGAPPAATPAAGTGAGASAPGAGGVDGFATAGAGAGCAFASGCGGAAGCVPC